MTFGRKGPIVSKGLWSMGASHKVTPYTLDESDMPKIGGDFSATAVVRCSGDRVELSNIDLVGDLVESRKSNRIATPY